MNNNVLIIGGTAPISNDIIKELKLNSYSIDLMTYRDINKINEEESWTYLDIQQYHSVEKFLNFIGNKKYNKIILNSASSPGNQNIKKTKREDLVYYYSNFFVNYMILVKNLLENISENGSIVYISSIAANVPIQDVNYATGKGAMQTFITSLSTHIKHQQYIFSIAPGLIYDTPAFYQNDPKNYNYDSSKLATKKQIAEIIIKSDNSFNGKVIKIGL